LAAEGADVISNLKTFLLGTFQGVSYEYIQEYLEQFVYRFNRRQWEPQIANVTFTGRWRHSTVARYPEFSEQTNFRI